MAAENRGKCNTGDNFESWAEMDGVLLCGLPPQGLAAGYHMVSVTTELLLCCSLQKLKFNSLNLIASQARCL